MGCRTRIKYTAVQKSDIWYRWERGESLNPIGRLFNRPSSSIFNMLASTGGILPPPHRQSRLSLTLAGREEISRGLARDLSVRASAARLGHAASTVSREVNHNTEKAGYECQEVHQYIHLYQHAPIMCHEPMKVHHVQLTAVGYL